MYIYYCWITALVPSYQDKIIAGMVKRGYMVGPAAKDGKVVSSTENNPAALIAISVYRAEETDVNKIYNDMVGVLTEMKAYYYSVVISHSYEATWAGANFSLPLKKQGVVEKASATPPPLPPGGKKNVN
jgi:hypothetical protein